MCGVFVMRQALNTLSHHGFAYSISLLQHVSFLFSLQAGIASAILSALAFRPVYRLQEATRHKNQAKVFLPLSPFTIFTEYRRRLGLKNQAKVFLPLSPFAIFTEYRRRLGIKNQASLFFLLSPFTIFVIRKQKSRLWQLASK